VIEATVLDSLLLASVLHHAKPNKMAKSDTLRQLAAAYVDGMLPISGSIQERLVRTALSASGADVPDLENPLPAPFDLSWYFGRTICPPEVRIFATRLSRPWLRVWSVTQVLEVPEHKPATVPADAWLVLCQVFGCDNEAEAVATASREAAVPCKALKNHRLAVVEPIKVDAKNMEKYMFDNDKTTLETKDGIGRFVEIILARST
jgi:hypothetical protein